MDNMNFLRSVVAYFGTPGPGKPAPEDIVYVLPNKRSAMFLKHYTRECVTSGVAMMPRFMTVQTFLGLFARYPQAPRNELLFILYNAYRSVMKSRGRAEGIRPFDSFIFWGDMMLADFDDIDRSLVNADDLYKNLRDVKEIQADYLDPDQKEVIRRVWGESRLTEAAGEFWLHTGCIDGDEPDSDKPMAAKFVYLWEILADVYHEFNRMLEDRRMLSAGGVFRSALNVVRGLSQGDFPAGEHYVFIGFNDLSTAETLIFDRLQQLGVASFFWDTAPLALVDMHSGNAAARPLQRLAALVRSFPMPEDYEIPAPRFDADTAITAVPSNIGQAKAVKTVLDKWLRDRCVDSHNPLNTAVILPDQGLLLPTLLSIPEEIDKVNISMGLAYRTTTFASLLHSLVSMQLRARQVHGTTHFFYEDVTAVLAHPHIQLVAAEEADRLNLFIADNRLYNISAARIAENAPSLAPVFVPMRDLNSAAEVAKALCDIFDWLSTRLSAEGSRAESFELRAIAYFREQVQAIAALVENYRVSMTDHTFLHLFERLLNTRGLTVNGTPLEGLQILGVLETRALDFDNVIILSMNESVFPRKQYTRTMIPNALRAAFGLPDFESLEWTYAYCFYRLLARAKRVQLMYDSRGDGIGNGEKSRYISQLQYLMPALAPEVRTVSYLSEADNLRTVEVSKTPEVMAELAAFRKGGRLRLSASALKTYKKCPLRFYLQYARSMRGSDELVDYISASEFGTVVHNTVQSLYAGLADKTVSATVLDRWLDPTDHAVDEAARRELIAVRYKRNEADAVLSAEANLACELVARIARANLLAERNLYCSNGNTFEFLGNEHPEQGVWHIDEGLDVNFFMSIDRLDRPDAESLRFIDFKTGDEDISTSEVKNLLSRDNTDKDGMFQLFTYSEAYLAMNGVDRRIQPVLHPMRRLSAGADLEFLKVKGAVVSDYRDYRDEFRPLVHDLIKEIFDPEVSFSQCPKIDGCKFCPFLTLCGRLPKSF